MLPQLLSLPLHRIGTIVKIVIYVVFVCLISGFFPLEREKDLVCLVIFCSVGI